MKTLHIGMIGLGTVGSGVWKILSEHRALLESRLGLTLNLKKIAVRDLKKKRELKIPPGVLTQRVEDIWEDPEITLVVEVMGGADNPYPAEALRRGKHVVTANKALLATRGAELLRLAAERGLFVGYEAAVAGGVPIIKAIEESFVGNRIQQLYGIINGTANFILSEMTEQGKAFPEVLQEAQKLGYAEQDPKMDIEGLDAAQKLAILVSLCFGTEPHASEIYAEGITRITPLDIQFAKKFGYVIKLLAVAKDHQGSIEARVHPTMVPESHPLAEVDGVFNAIYLKGDAIGESMFLGRGAGSLPTASSIVSDVAMLARLTGSGVKAPLIHRAWQSIPYRKMDEIESRYYLRFSVLDKPGVMAQIAGILGNHAISISSVYQHDRDEGAKVPIVVMTHQAKERDVQQSLKAINDLETVVEDAVLIRVEE